MVCSNCGNPNSDNARFCGKCGTPLEVTAPLQPVAPNGTQQFVQQAPEQPIMPTAPQIAPMQTTGVQGNPAQTVPHEQNKVSGIIVVVALIVALVVGGVFAAKQFSFLDGVLGGKTSAAVASSEADVAPLTWQEQYDLGTRFIGEGNYQEAIIAFAAAITIDPKKPEAYISLADVYIATEQLEKALELLVQAEVATAGDESIAEKKEEVEALLFVESEPSSVPEPDLNDPTVVTWNNPSVEKMVRMAMNKPEGDITQGELNGITELYIYGEGYAELEDTATAWAFNDEMVNVRFYGEEKEDLSFPYGAITDISDLQKMPYLRDLTIEFNPIDLTSLAGLANLTNLVLHYNSISNLAPLVEFTNLTELGLAFNQITDLTPLAELTNLTVVSLNFNQITDVTPLAGMTNLTHLGFFANQIVDVTPLAGLTGLTVLNLDDNPVADWSPVAHIDNVIGRP